MPDFEWIVGKAAQVVSEQFRDAVLYHARGFPAGSTAAGPDDFSRWAFVFQLSDSYVTITWNGSKLDPAQTHAGMSLGDQPITPPLPVTFSAAVEILRKGGYSEGITLVDLRKPLYPGVKEPAYIFAFGKPPALRLVSVGALSGELTTG